MTNQSPDQQCLLFEKCYGKLLCMTLKIHTPSLQVTRKETNNGKIKTINTILKDTMLVVVMIESWHNRSLNSCSPTNSTQWVKWGLALKYILRFVCIEKVIFDPTTTNLSTIFYTPPFHLVTSVGFVGPWSHLVMWENRSIERGSQYFCMFLMIIISFWLLLDVSTCSTSNSRRSRNQHSFSASIAMCTAPPLLHEKWYKFSLR